MSSSRSDKAYPVSQPKLWGKEAAAVAACVDSGWISSEGPQVTDFENALAKHCDRKHCVAVTSGTAALDVAFAALNLHKGDEVIVAPSICIISCYGGTVVFFCLDSTFLRDKRAFAIPQHSPCLVQVVQLRLPHVHLKVVRDKKCLHFNVMRKSSIISFVIDDIWFTIFLKTFRS